MLTDQGALGHGVVYGKVASSADDAKVIRINLTAVPPEVRTLFEQLEA